MKESKRFLKKIDNSVIVYIRSYKKEKNSFSVEVQENIINDYCKSRGLNIIEIFKDENISGASLERKEIERMFDYCKNNFGKIKSVVVLDLTRFSSNKRNRERIRYFFRKKGIKVTSIVDIVKKQKKEKKGFCDYRFKREN